MPAPIKVNICLGFENFVMEYFYKHCAVKVTMVELLLEINRDFDILTKLGIMELLAKYK